MDPDGQSDRDLQDALITYLSDANLRHAATALPLSPEQAQRADKFARFLARRYYRDRLARSFRCSPRFGAAAEAVVDTPEFDAFLEHCVLGSLAAAERVGAMAAEYLGRIAAPGPWWADLLQYERLFFLQAASSESPFAGEFPQPSPCARCQSFSWMLPEVLSRLKSGNPIGEELRRAVTLLFSRTRHGRIYVVELNEATAAAFHAADGRRNPAQIARSTLLPLDVVQQALAALEQVGAVVAPS